MKKVLLASTALVLSAGVAAADIATTGNARMGVLKDFTTDDVAFSSRFRVIFTGSGETSGGLSFGASVRADQDSSSQPMTVGSVFISGDFGTLTMGDVSGAPEAAVGDVAGVGMTGLGFLNETIYLSNGDRPAMRYDYSFGEFGVHVSADNPAAAGDTAIGAAVSYKGGAFSAGLGFETDNGTDHIVAGVEAGFAGATVKATFGTADGALNGDQYALSVRYGFGATTATAYFADNSELGGAESFGIGASYDLGGGAALVGGYVSNETTNNDAFDFGITMTF